MIGSLFIILSSILYLKILKTKKIIIPIPNYKNTTIKEYLLMLFYTIIEEFIFRYLPFLVICIILELNTQNFYNIYFITLLVSSLIFSLFHFTKLGIHNDKKYKVLLSIGLFLLGFLCFLSMPIWNIIIHLSLILISNYYLKNYVLVDKKYFLYYGDGAEIIRSPIVWFIFIIGILLNIIIKI
jgi:hypothetical protein